MYNELSFLDENITSVATCMGFSFTYWARLYAQWEFSNSECNLISRGFLIFTGFLFAVNFSTV